MARWMLKTVVLGGALLLASSVHADNFLRDLVGEVAKEVTQSKQTKGSSNKQASSSTTTGGEVAGLKYLGTELIFPRWRVSDYTPEQINGYHHLRIGFTTPFKYRPIDGDASTLSPNCETRFLGAAWWTQPFNSDNLMAACANNGDPGPSPEYIADRIAYYEGKNKFYFRGHVDVRWNSHLKQTVVTVIPPLLDLIASPEIDARGNALSEFQLEGPGISNVHWSPAYNYETSPKPITDRPRYQTFLSNDRSEFPKGNAYNTVFFTLTGQPRLSKTLPTGVKIFSVPVTIDRIEIADPNTGLAIDNTKK